MCRISLSHPSLGCTGRHGTEAPTADMGLMPVVGHFRRFGRVPRWSGLTQLSEVRIKLRHFGVAPVGDKWPLPWFSEAHLAGGRRTFYVVDSNSHTPPTAKAMPARRAIKRPIGASFSNRTRRASTVIQSMLMTPPTNNNTMSTQQQPIQ